MIYLDHAATTPLPRPVADAMYQVLTEEFGNPSAQYALGRAMAERVAAWRKTVADALDCPPEALCFTSCGTEGDNWAIQGAIQLGRRKGKHIVATAYEHAAVLEPCRSLERQGYEVTWLKPDREGSISLGDLERALRPDTVLVSMMLVNNELGTILPVAETARVLKEAGSGALLHCDGVQGFLKVPFTPKELGVDMLSISGHKIHAPKGIGAMYLRKGLKISPFIRGGGQENGLRSGTEATGQLAALAAAVTAGRATLERDLAAMADLKQYAMDRLKSAVPQGKVLVEGGAPHILPISLVGYKSEVVVRFLSDRGVYISSGSACHKGKPSHVYAALKLPKKEQDGALRLSFSYDTTREDIDALVEGLQAAQAQLFPAMS